jgi:hypothetical protein
MKTLLTILALSALIIPSSSLACKISLQGQEQPAVVDSETVLVVEYTQSHRKCPLSLETIKFNAKGMDILGATPWEEIDAKTFQRKFKVKINQPDCVLAVKRSCDKGGLDEELVVQTQK